MSSPSFALLLAFGAPRNVQLAHATLLPRCWPQNNKDYFDQSLDEIKLLKYVNTHDPQDHAGIVRLYDYFYFKVS
jgi:hypothetical protein